MARTSQATIAIILGIALLLMITIGFSIGKSAITKRTTQEMTKTQTTTSEVKPIIQHITTCLDSTSADALKLLGDQGGIIYRNQGGIFADPIDFHAGALFAPFQGQKVNYGISPGLVLLPAYPTTSAPYGPDQPTPGISLGTVLLPPINGSSSSFAYQLEQYISSAIDSCIDYAFFEKQGYSFSKGEKSTHAAFGEQTVDITLSYPLTISNSITQEEISLQEFKTIYGVRLLGMHTALSSILNNEVNDILLNISKVNAPQDMSLAILHDVHNHDDILILKDTQSSISGKPYEIHVARHNRNPALHYLKPNQTFHYLSFGKLNFSHNTEITKELLASYLLAPAADDPDEDSISYQFTVESRSGKPQLPQTITTPDMTVRITASDGELEDYQDIFIIRNPFTP